MNNLSKSGKSMFDFMTVFRNLENEIQAQTIQTYLFVAMHDKKDIPMAELGEALGLSQASVSRNVSFFSKINRHQSKGAGLLGSREDPQDRRRKLVYLTPKGTMFFAELESRWKQ
jgi:DNA-binding MarR family transcriptional regulator